MITYILTGGTIGSSIGEDGIAHPDADLSSMLGTDADIRIPYNIQSENLDGRHLNLLIEETGNVIKEGRSEGVVITHGSDTLQYSAAMLCLIFGKADIPIVLVAANYVLSDPRSNGEDNLYYARRFIEEKRAKGVFVCYRNTGEDVKIHAGDMLLEHEAFSDTLRSADDRWYATYRGSDDPDGAEYVANPRYRGERSFAMSRAESVPADGCILRIDPYPGMRYPEIDDEVKAVLLNTYHSGTICIDDGLRSFAQESGKRKINIYLCGLSREATEYESISHYEELGIKPVYDITPGTVYCMLWLKNGVI